MRCDAFVRPLLVRPHQPRVARHSGGKDRGETAFDGLLHGFPPGRAIIAETPPEPRDNAGFSAFPPVLPLVFVFGSGSAGARCLATRRFVEPTRPLRVYR